MTKHIYKCNNLTGIVLSGDYKSTDIIETLKKSARKFKFAGRISGIKEFYVATLYENGAVASMAVSFEGFPSDPRNIVASVLETAGKIGKDYLTKYLDSLVLETGIRELNSESKEFAEVFRAWELYAKAHGWLEFSIEQI